MDIEITDHAKKRLKQRLGINYKASKTQAQRAFKFGEIIGSAERDTKMLINYNNIVYVFALNSENNPILVTVINPESEFKYSKYSRGEIVQIKSKSLITKLIK